MRSARQILFSCLFLLASCREPSSQQTQPQSKPCAPRAVANEEEFFLPRAESIKGRRAPQRDESSVRLKLKRDPKDGYSWELSGSSASDILKVDKQLRRELLPQKEGPKGRE